MAIKNNKNGMVDIHVRNIEPTVYDKLKKIAAHLDIKPTELHRRILKSYAKNYKLPGDGSGV